jgi:hypothetical protein
MLLLSTGADKSKVMCNIEDSMSGICMLMLRN